MIIKITGINALSRRSNTVNLKLVAKNIKTNIKIILHDPKGQTQQTLNSLKIKTMKT